MKLCQNCASPELMAFCVKHQDMLYAGVVNNAKKCHDGYGIAGVPCSKHGDDYMDFEVCLTCGTMQGVWGTTVAEVLAKNEDGFQS